ncbi:MAG: DUF512 domain-containing protein [Selenomonadaceae bacterium]|nr:DUF512 domain-containing protein [Selenomonadaceae bacterium]
MAFGKISKIIKNSIAEELGLIAGDKIISVNDFNVRDIIDFSFAFADEEIDLLVEHNNGEREIISFDKDYDEELGVEFESAVDAIKPCKNNCVFCFINMMAKNARKSLYVKDDDYRLSFLYGNFITLTNMTDEDYKRIKNFHLSPLCVSIQAINPDLRAKMLRNKNAADILNELDKLDAAGAYYHTQIVLCKDLNDGNELERTVKELSERENVLSIAVVPVGVTKHRRDDFPLKQFDKDSAKKVIESMQVWQEKFRAERGETFLYLGDEFYILAGEEIPSLDYYDDFPQLENGIGLTRNFIAEFEESLRNFKGKMCYNEPYCIDIICGVSAKKFLQILADKIMQINKNLNIKIIAVTNKFFGEKVNVSGLLSGRDILNKLKETKEKINGIIIPAASLRSGEEIFLDDYSLKDLKAEFPDTKIEAVKTGTEFFLALADFKNYSFDEKVDAMKMSNAGYI